MLLPVIREKFPAVSKWLGWRVGVSQGECLVPHHHWRPAGLTGTTGQVLSQAGGGGGGCLSVVIL